jgi:hypothetical protein
MSYGIWVPAARQFGQLGANDELKARRSTVTRQRFLAIQRYLFAEDEPQARAEPPRALAGALAAFTEALKTIRFAPRHARMAELIDGLAEEADASGAEQAAFCLAVHGLCWCLATAGLAASPVGEEDDEEDEEGAEDAGDDDAGEYEQALAGDGDEASNGSRSGIAFSIVADKISELLLRSRRRPQTLLGCGASPERAAASAEPPGAARPSRNEARLLAEMLLRCLLHAMPHAFVLRARAHDVSGRRKEGRVIALASPRLQCGIDRLLRALPDQFTVQPLAEPVRHDPAKGRDADPSAIHIPLVAYRRRNEFLDSFLASALDDSGKGPFDYRPYRRAVNAQQAVAWRINARLLQHARCLAGLALPKANWPEGAREAVVAAGLDHEAVSELRAWVHQSFCRPHGQRRPSGTPGPGEFLENPIAAAALQDLAELGRDGLLRRFYLPWKADYRGRIYAQTPWFTPQGADLQRALFEFADGRTLDGSGIAALRRHGANLARRGRVLSDLGVKGRQVLTLDERERWVEANADAIVRSGESPLRNPFWRQVSDEPLRFLAFCMAYAEWRADPAGLLHLPVEIDGTCNGLQHIAALTGDEELARAVNVLPQADGLPADIYSELATRAQQNVGQLCSILNDPLLQPRLEGKPLPSQLKEAMEELDCILASNEDMRRWLDRSAAKPVVMTIPYGASAGSQANALLRKIENRLESALDDTTIAPMLGAFARKHLSAFGEDEKLWKIIRKTSRRCFKHLHQKRKTDVRDRLGLLNVVGTCMAWVFVAHLRDALRVTFPVAEAFAAWLRQVAKSCAGLPLMWITPLGLPVCQDKFRLGRTTISARLGGERISVGIRQLTEWVSETRQEQALLPNLVHSLDSTHLAMTLNAAWGENIRQVGSIHDCLLCHPNDAERLGELVRAAFTALHEPDTTGARPRILCAWSNWMQLLAMIAATPYVNIVRGALDYPGQAGERMLEQRLSGKAEQHALLLLDRLRKLEGAHLQLARVLLDYASAVPSAKLSKEERKERAEKGERWRPLHAIDAEFPALSSPGALPLAGGLSPYFFS